MFLVGLIFFWLKTVLGDGHICPEEQVYLVWCFGCKVNHANTERGRTGGMGWEAQSRD